MNLTFDDTAVSLFDVHVFGGFGETDDQRLLESFDEITLLELSDVEFMLNEGERLEMIGSSIQGGDIDVMLATDNPFDEDTGMIDPLGDQTTVFLQQFSVSDPGFVTITEVNLVTVIVPEANALTLAMCGVVIVLIYFVGNAATRAAGTHPPSQSDEDHHRRRQ